MTTRWHIVISGKVQGVFYRVSTQQKALELTLKGWVQNLPDGRVEIQAEGSKTQLQALLTWCREGPPQAEVEAVIVNKDLPVQGNSGFFIRR